MGKKVSVYVSDAYMDDYAKAVAIAKQGGFSVSEMVCKGLHACVSEYEHGLLMNESTYEALANGDFGSLCKVSLGNGKFFIGRRADA